MILDLSSQQMLQTWRSHAGLEPAGADCSIVAFDAVDIDPYISLQMRQWYLDLLDRGDLGLLAPPADVADRLALSSCDSRGFAIISPSRDIRRVVDIRLDGWAHAVHVVDQSDAADRLAAMANPLVRPTDLCPLAYRLADGRIAVAPAPDGAAVAEAHAVVDPGPYRYIIDESALATIPAFNLQSFQPF